MKNLKLITALAMALSDSEVRSLEASLIHRKKLGVQVYDLDSIMPDSADHVDVINMFNGMIRTALSATPDSGGKFLSKQGDIDAGSDAPANAPATPEMVAAAAAEAATTLGPVEVGHSSPTTTIPGVTAPSLVAEVMKTVDPAEPVKEVMLKAAVAKPPVEETGTVVLNAVNAAPSQTDTPVATESQEVILDSKAAAQALASVAMRDAVVENPSKGIPDLKDSPAALETAATRIAAEFGEDKSVVKELLMQPIMSQTTFDAISKKPSSGAIARFQLAQGDIGTRKDNEMKRCVITPGSTSPILALPLTKFATLKHRPAVFGNQPWMQRVKTKEGDLDSILGTIGGWFIKDISNAMAEIIEKKSNPTPAEARRLRDYKRLHAAEKAKEEAYLRDLNSEGNAMDAEELGRLANKIVELRKKANAREYELAAKENLQPKLQYSADDLDPYKIHPIMVARIEDVKNAYASTQSAINSAVSGAVASSPGSESPAVVSQIPAMAAATAENLGNSAETALVPLSHSNPAYNVFASGAVNSKQYEDWMDPEVINKMAQTMSADMERALSVARSNDAAVAASVLKLARIRHVIGLLQADYQVIGMLKNSPLDFTSPEAFIRSLLYAVRHLKNIGALTPYASLIESMKNMDDEELLSEAKKSWFGDVRHTRGSGDISMGDLRAQGDLNFQAQGDIQALLADARSKLKQPASEWSISSGLAHAIDGAAITARDIGSKLGPEGKVMAAILGTLVAAKTIGPTVAAYAAGKRNSINLTTADKAKQEVNSLLNDSSDIVRDAEGRIINRVEEAKSNLSFPGPEGDDIVIPADAPYKWLKIGRAIAQSHTDDEWTLAPAPPLTGDLFSAEAAFEGGFFSSIGNVVKKIGKGIKKVVSSPIVKFATSLIPGAAGVADVVSGILGGGADDGGGQSESPVLTTTAQSLGVSPAQMQAMEQTLTPAQQAVQVVDQAGTPLAFGPNAQATKEPDSGLKTIPTKELLMTRMFVDDAGKVVGIKDIYRDDVLIGDVDKFNTNINVISSFSVGMPVYDVPRFNPYGANYAIKNLEVKLINVPKLPDVPLKDMKVDVSLKPSDYSYSLFGPNRVTAPSDGGDKGKAQGDVVPVQTLPGSTPGTTIQLVRVGSAFAGNMGASNVPQVAYTPSMAANALTPSFADASDFEATENPDEYYGPYDSQAEEWEQQVSTISGDGQGDLRTKVVTWLTTKSLNIMSKIWASRTGLVKGAKFLVKHPRTTAIGLGVTYLVYRGATGGSSAYSIEDQGTLTSEEANEMLSIAEEGANQWKEAVENITPSRLGNGLARDRASRFKLRYDILVRKYNLKGESWKWVKDAIGSWKRYNQDFTPSFEEGPLIAMTMPWRDELVMKEWRKKPDDQAIVHLQQIQALYYLLSSMEGDVDARLLKFRASFKTKLVGTGLNPVTIDTFYRLLADTKGKVHLMKPVYVMMLDAILDMILTISDFSTDIESIMDQIDAQPAGSNITNDPGMNLDQMTQADADAALAAAARGDKYSPKPRARQALEEAGIIEAGKVEDAKTDKEALTDQLFERISGFVKSPHFKILAAIVGTAAATAIIAKLLAKGGDAAAAAAELKSAGLPPGSDASLGSTAGPDPVLVMKYH